MRYTRFSFIINLILCDNLQNNIFCLKFKLLKILKCIILNYKMRDIEPTDKIQNQKDIDVQEFGVCPMIFSSMEVRMDGNAYFCCEHKYNNLSLGNIYKDDLNDIWNSKLAVTIREEALKGKYPYCKGNVCLRLAKEIPDFVSVKSIFIPHPEPVMTKTPYYIAISKIKDCNARCIFCSDEIYKTPDNELNNIISILKNYKDLKCLTIWDSGDAFSLISQKFIKLISEEFPDLRFKLMTNGILADKETINRLNLVNRIEELDISINAVNAATHNKIFRTGKNAFKKLIKNLEYIKTLKINTFNINFVVCKYNWKEMKKFIKLGKKYNARVLFWEVRLYGNSDKLQYDYYDIAVHLRFHKDYKKFKKYLSSKVFEDENIIMSPVLKKLRYESLNEKKFSLDFVNFLTKFHIRLTNKENKI